MAISSLLLLLSVVTSGCVHGQELLIDTAKVDQPFYGIGGLSGGGATSRLLVDYVEPQRSEILDLLFKPNYGASLQVLKVEIGGDAQSTDGTEPSHMHTADDLDYHRGYEWWLLAEAKKRNPDIKTYGLPWAFPGWVGGPEESGSPFKHPDLTSNYMLKWLEGARKVYGIDVDYVGIWNERSSDGRYAKTLRKTLDSHGFANTTIVAKDGDARICNDLAKDPPYAEAIGVIGLHYPTDFADYSACRKLGYGVKGGRPIWSSEESSSYDDLNGAACWARIIAAHYVLQGFTSSIMWNLVGAYYHGTNWFASSMFTAVEPWSGHYESLGPVWATAHVTQFTQVGWHLLELGSGSGQLPKGGFYTTYADTESGNWTLVLVKIDRDHASCTRPSLPDFPVEAEDVTFRLPHMTSSTSVSPNARRLSLWYSNFEETDSAGRPVHLFERRKDLQVSDDGSFRLHVPLGGVFTVSTILDERGPGANAAGTYPPVPPSNPSFPLPYHDDFEQCAESQEGKFWADQIGVFEVHVTEGSEGSNKVMRQMVPQEPVSWVQQARGPVSVLGMREWQDIEVAASFRLPAGVASGAAACIGSRVDQLWDDGLVLCMQNNGTWTLGVGGPKTKGGPSAHFGSGSLGALPSGVFCRLMLRTIGDRAWGSLEVPSPWALGGQRQREGSRHSLFEAVAVRDLDTGFAALGASGLFAVEFDDVSVRAVGPSWQPPRSPCPASPATGSPLRLRRCVANGLSAEDQAFELLTNWAILHVPSGLCAAAAAAVDFDDVDSSEGGPSVPVVLVPCNAKDPRQQFRNDYTLIRNTEENIQVGKFQLTGHLQAATVVLERTPGGLGSFAKWSYFPNTKQLRNQYTANTHLGYPLCLSTCSGQEQEAAAEVAADVAYI